ncbi:MAG TPA: C69 family dipeptidase [Candidatus Aminicenantes bacterium]|nr:C69 family dipeptidase [Candidatus Aminicenantes bacterium]
MKIHIWTWTIVLLLALAPAAPACTNYLVTRGASQDGSTFITYSADSHSLYGDLNFIPAGEHIAGTWIDVFDGDSGKFLGRIRQVPRTWQVVGLINEHQVALGETTFGGREELMDPKAVVDYGSLMNLALQRARTAREALQVMTSLVAEYGYASSGESFSISDPNEAWILEMISKGPERKGAVWVARQVPDGYVCGHANQARIHQFPLQKANNFSDRKQTTFHSPDVIAFAREKGYFKGSDAEFSFAAAYCPPDFGGRRACDARVWQFFRRVTPDSKQMDAYEDWALGIKADAAVMPLFVKPDRKLSLRDMMELMRDHFEGSPMDMTRDIGAGPFVLPYRWRPMSWKPDQDAKEEYFFERATSTQQTAYSFVAQSRSWLPGAIGGIFWVGMDDTNSTVYAPMYCGIRQVPPSYAKRAGGFDRFSWDSAFWVFNFVANWAYSRYCDMIQDIQAVQREIEGKYLAVQPEIEAAALELFKRSPELARERLTAYSVGEGEALVRRWRELGERLIWKYIDGNVRDSQGHVTHPEYPKEWYQRIIRETGDRFQVPQAEKK